MSNSETARDPHAKMRFRQIENRGILKDGRVITTVRTYPNGADIKEYRRLDTAFVRAFGTENSQTIGTPFA